MCMSGGMWRAERNIKETCREFQNRIKIYSMERVLLHCPEICVIAATETTLEVAEGMLHL